MDQRVEPPSWLPEGAAPEGADEVTLAANGSADPDSAGERTEPATQQNGAGSGTSASGSAEGSAEETGETAAEHVAGDPGEATADSAAEPAVDSAPEPVAESAAAAPVPAGGAEPDLPGHDTVSASLYTYQGDATEPPVPAPAPAADDVFARPQADDVFSPPQAGSDVFSRPAREEVSAEAEPYTYRQAAPYAYDQGDQYGFSQESPDATEYAAGSGYNHEVMSEPAGDPAVPPYPAELPSQSAAAASSVPTLASAAYRAIPKPKFKTRPAAKPKAAARAGAGGRRANLVIARLEPWSVMKFSFLMSLVAWVVLFVAVALLYYLLSGIGVFDALQKTLASVTSSQTSAGVDLSKWTSASRILGYTMLIGAVNIVIITALSTVGAMIYNLVTHLGGGIEVTLRETD